MRAGQPRVGNATMKSVHSFHRSMKILFLPLVATLLLAAIIPVDTPDLPWREGMTSPRLRVLKKQVQRGNSAAVGQFWEEMKARHTPLVETIPNDRAHVLVTFLYQAPGPTKSVVLIGQLSASRDPADNVLTHLLDTDVWYKTYLLGNDVRLSYGFVRDPTPESLTYHSESQLRDMLNPAYVPGTINIGHSVLELPAARPQLWTNPRPGVLAGRVEEEQFASKILDAQRRVWVYTPAGYDSKRTTPYPLLVCFDGSVYSSQEWVPTPTVLDNLIFEGKIPPMLAVFVDQSAARNLELSNNPQFADFVATELLPQVRKKWRVTSDPLQTTVCGSSAGGLASAFTAFRHPDVFGNVLSQSGAFWPGKTRDNPDQEWLTHQLELSPKLPVRFVLQVGLFEITHTPLNGPSILTANRHLRDVLRTRKYELYYREVAGGHEPLTWRGGVAEGLIQLQGKEEDKPKN